VITEPSIRKKLRVFCGLTAACLLFPACRKSDHLQDAAWWSLEADRVELAQQVELLKIRETRFDAGREALVRALGELAEARQTRTGLDDEADSLHREIGDREAHVAEWLDKRLQQIRASHQGAEMDVLTSKSGRTYRQIRISRVTEAGIEFRHQAGIARLTADDLDRQQLLTFGLNAERSQEIVTREAEQAQAYSEAVTRTARALEKREKERAQVARVTASQKAADSRSRVSDTDDTVAMNPLRQKPRSFGRTSRRSGRFYNVWYTSGSSCGSARYGYQSPYRTFAPTRPRTASRGVWSFPDPNPTYIRR
jgi:hypothetical protein